MSGKSTTDLVENFTEFLYRALNDNKHAVGVTLDLSKAFNLIKYDALLNKLKITGIQDKLLNLLVDNFKDRMIGINMGNFISKPLNLYLKPLV